MLLAAAVTASRFLRRHTGRILSRLHLPLALGALGTLLWHVFNKEIPRIPAIVAGSMWISTSIYNLFEFISGVEVRVENVRGDSEVSVVQLCTRRRPFTVFPGGYFYVLHPGPVFTYSPFSRHAMTAAWYTPGRLVTDVKVTSITMLVSNHSLHHPLWLEKNQNLRLLGPYGRDLGLSGYETVILTAKGIGIAGVLPLALSLAERKLHDNRVKEEYSSQNKDAKNKKRSSEESKTLVNLTAKYSHDDRTNHAQGQEGSSEAYGKDSSRATSLDTERGVGKELLKRPIDQRKSSRLFRDATRKVDLFWELERNCQDEWVSGELKALQSMDPHNVCSAHT